MTDITKVVDGDTIETSEDRVRISNINTPESVHPNDDLNTEEGKVASEFASDLLPTGSEIKQHDYGRDHFGRRVAGVSRNINGVDIDYGLVALDQQMSTYFTEYGEHPDPTKHDEYKEYYNKHVPYQFGATEEPLSQEELVDIHSKQERFREVYSKFKEGEATQEEFDQATADLYQDSNKVMRYRHQLSQWNRPIEEENPNSLRGAMRLAIEENPELREQYNRAVRNGHLQGTVIPEDEPAFWDKVKTSFSMFSSVSNKVDFDMLYDARRLGEDYGVPEEELIKGIPEQYHSAVLQEAVKHNEQSALILRDQLIEDIENNTVFDNMEAYAQFGYGALAILADPLTLAPAGTIAKTGQGINAGIRAYTTNKAVRSAGVLSTWAASGAIEGSIINAPRLAADHTYTAKDYQLDIIYDSAFGLGLGTAVEGVGKPLLKKFNKYMSNAKEARKLEEQEIQEYVERQAKGTQEVAKTTELVQVQEQAKVATNEQVTKSRVGSLSATKFTPWEAITEVSPEGFSIARSTLENTFKQGTPVRILINSQAGLNKKNLTPEERELANKLNSDILHIASAFPDGKVPKNVEKAITGVTFRQKTTTRNNAISDILQGNTSSQTKTLKNYVKSLQNRTELWEGYDPIPLTSSQFLAQQSDWLARTGEFTDELSNLSHNIPKEISFVKDVIELNKEAAKRGDPEFTQHVETLNGLTAVRLEQKDFGTFQEFGDSTKSFGKTVPMSAQELVAQLKKEGLPPRTQEYSDRLAELKKTGRAAVSDEVNTIGRVDEFEVGAIRTEADPEAPKHHSIDDAEKELFKLQSKPNPTKEDVSYADYLKKLIQRSKLGSKTTLVKDTLDKDLLPRGFTEVRTQEAFKNPTKETLTELRSKLDKEVIKKLGLKVIKGKSERKVQQERLEVIKKNLLKDKQKVLDRMIKAGQWQNVEDVIRASDTIAQEQKRLDAAYKPLTEDEVVEVLESKARPEVVDKIQDAYEKRVAESTKKVSDELSKFVRTGEQDVLQLATKPTGILDSIGRVAGKLTEDLATKFIKSDLTASNYIGSRLTELGRGYGGKIRRKATGGIIRDAKFKESIMQIVPSYVRIMDDYAKENGKGVVGRLFAQQKSGAESKIVDKFNKEVFKVQELRRQGKELPANTSKQVLQFVDDFNKYMDYNHSQLVENKVAGFVKKRKIKNYIPHIWIPSKLDRAIKTHGEDKVVELFKRAYQASSTSTKPLSSEEAGELAKKQLEWISSQKENPIDQYSPVADSRAKQRLDLDTTMEYEGISILDILDTDVVGMSVKYSNRVGGWLGLAKSTDGMLSTQLDIDTFKANLIEEGKSKGIDTGKQEQFYDDLIDLMFGRPTRGGLNQELRQFKDLTALTRMGGLGTAQLIETGQVVTRSVLNTFSSEPVIRKILKTANDANNEEGLIREVQSISNITDDLEFLERQSVHLDQAELEKVGKMRQTSLWLADKATFGSLKAPASRLLGKTTGYNAIRRTQSRVTQASFIIDVAKHFKDGSGVMGNKRMADLGLTDVDGTDIELQEMFNTYASFDKDGVLEKLNIDKWSTSAREKLQYAIIRDEAQQIQRTHVGELPPWMNKPLMGLIFQFRQMPIVANNKQLGRSLAFADKEAVTATMLNTALSGIVRYGKFAALGYGVHTLTKDEWKEPTSEQMQVDKYITQLGIFADASDLVLDSYKAGMDGEPEKLLGQVPVMGLMKDYYDLGASESSEQIDAAQGLTPLGNTAYGDMIHTWIQETFGE